MWAKSNLPKAEAIHTDSSLVASAGHSANERALSWYQESRHYHVRSYTLSKQCQDFLEQNGPAPKVQVFLEAVWALVLSRHSDQDEIRFSACNDQFRASIMPEALDTNFRVDVSNERRLVDVMDSLFKTHVDTSRPSSPIGEPQTQSTATGGSESGSFIKTFEALTEGSLDSAKQSYPLAAYISTGDDRLLVVSHDDSLAAEKAVFLLDHFATAIGTAQEVFQNPELTMGSIDMISLQEREMILNLGAAKSTATSTTTLVEMWERQASRVPNLIAVREFEGESWTYGQLNSRANQIARLAKLEPQKFFAVCMDRSVHFIATLLAILKSGSAYVILDPEGAEKRNADIVAQVESNVVLVDDSYAHLFENALVVESLSDTTETSSKNLQVKISLDDACYVQFTSGSTGRPKGAIITHRAATSGIRNFRLNGCLNWLLFYNPIFSAAQRTMLAPLIHGAVLCLASKQSLTMELSRVVNDMEIDSLGLTPSALSLLSPEHVPKLKQVTLVGESLPKKTMDLWCDKLSLRNTYGLSEVTQINFGRVLKSSDDPTVIGAPADTTQAYILVPGSTELAPVSILGELCLAGPQVSIGYIGRSEETDRSFIQNPFGDGKLYRTGDGARRLPNGDIQVSGRLDFQVKINGQRVEPKEVDQAILSIDQVVDCATVAIEYQERKVLIAGVVLADNSTWTETLPEIKKHAGQHLPEYMLPRFWYPLNEVPKSATGKVNLGQLRQFFSSLSPEDLRGYSRSSVEHESISEALEQQIQMTWAHVLNVEPEVIGRRDSFPELGGSSIEAIGAIRELREQGIAVDLSHFLSRTPLNELAELSSKIDLEAADPEPFSLLSTDDRLYFQRQESVEDAYYATPLQKGLIVATLAGADHYMYQRYWSIKGVDLSKLRDAVEHVFRTNPILRSTFVMHNGNFVQVVKRNFQLPWIEHAGKIKQVTSTDDFKKTELGQPLLRVNVVDSKVMIVGMHHALFDHWSHRFLYDDIADAYRGVEMKSRPPFSRFLKYVQDIDQEQEVDFWHNFLKGSPQSIINKDVQESTVKVSKVLPTDLTSRLRPLGITSGTAVYAAWALVLSQQTNNNDVVYGVTLSGRDIPVPGIDTMDGPTLATVPLRAKFDDENSLLDVARDIQENLMQVNKHAQRGMAGALRDGELSTDVLDSLVNILIPNESQAASEGILRPYGPRPFWQSEYTTLEVEAGAELQLRLSAAMSKRRAEFVLDQVCTALEQLTEQADSLVKHLDLVGEDERAFLLSKPDFHTVEPEFLHARFEAKASKSPDTIAIDWEGVRNITYGELDIMANQLAHYLIDQGVKPHDRIPMMFEKSVEMVASILAILKCGAAYAPMDPHNPVDRNAFIVDECDASVVFAHLVHAEFDEHHKAKTVFYENANFYKLETTRPDLEIELSDLAYIIYTSGSTGKPKGVQVPHCAASSAVTSMLDVEGRHEGEWRTLQFANYVFDASVQDIFNTLSSAGTLCMAPTDKILSDLTGLLNKMNVQQIMTTPTVAKLINPDDVPSLRKLLLGGEQLRSEVVDDWVPEREILNIYGPAETSMTISTKNVTPGSSTKVVGKPYPTVAAFIMRPDDTRLVPWGGVGELVIGGPQVSNGYAKRPDLTKQAFINGADFGFDKLYRTGDYARFLETGELECLGRKDTQVKIHGQRIELGEIEAAIDRTRIFHDAVVTVTNQGDKSQLAAFVDLNDASNPEIREPQTEAEKIQQVIQGLSGLTPYMIPKLVVPVGQFPKLVSRKVDRKTLQAKLNAIDPKDLQLYSIGQTSGTREVVPVTTENEIKMEKIWADLFAVERDSIGKHATFLALGGDSITAINLVSHARTAGLKLNVAQVLAAKNLEHLAASAFVIDASAEEAKNNAQYQTPVEVVEQAKAAGLDVSTDIEYFYPSPPGQTEFLNWGAHEDQMWQLQTFRKIGDHYSIAAWKESCEELVRLNDILRTTWTRTDGGDWVGIVLKDHHINMPEMTYASATERDQQVDKFWSEKFTFGKPFIKFGLLIGPAGEREIAVKLDHAMYDGTLFRIFDDQFSAIQKGHHVPPHPQFKDFARYNWLADKEPALKFWRNTLANPPANFRQDISEPRITKFVATNTDVALDAICSASNVTPSVVFQAAFQLWLAKSTEGSKGGDVTFDYLLSGRNVDMENPQLINGNLANFLPFRTGSFEDGTAVSKYLQSTQDFFWAATENGTVGLDDIYKSTGLDRKIHGNRVMFLFQPFDPPNGSRSEEMRWIVMGKSQVKMIQPYALVIEVSKTVTGHRVKFMYDEEKFEEEQAKIFAKEIVETAEAIAAGSADDAVAKYL